MQDILPQQRTHVGKGNTACSFLKAIQKNCIEILCEWEPLVKGSDLFVPMAEAAMEVDGEEVQGSNPSTVVDLLRRFLAVQETRAAIYSRLRRGFKEYLITGADPPYQQLCSQITTEFNDCSKQVLEMECILAGSDYHREDLASLLKKVQAHEKQKLHMTAMIQILKKAGRPSERLVTHEHCQFTNKPFQHQCVHVHEITEATGLEDAEADAEYDAALNEAIRAVQEAVTCINDHMEEVRYEIEELESNEHLQN